jgi:GT2 family glycosyltransferase
MNLQQHEGNPPQEQPAVPDRWKSVSERFGLLASLGVASFPRLGIRAAQVWKESGWKAVRGKVREILAVKRRERNYVTWMTRYDTLTEADRQAIAIRISQLSYQPLISVIMPVYNVDETWLRLAIESVCRQLYPHWELCIADDKSDKPHVRSVLEEYSRKDKRIRVVYRETRGHISAASNSAIELTHGEFIALLDHDDELSEHALYMVAEELNAFPYADLIFSDEDKLNQHGARFEPHFKPDRNPDLLYSYNCISHLGVYRTEIVTKIGGFRQGYEGSQDYDLALRVIEQIQPDHIRHIPHVLYHWRQIAGSLSIGASEKEYAHEAARDAIRSHFQRTGIKATVAEGYESFHRVIYPVPDPAPLVSVIIATRDHPELLSQTVAGVLNETDYAPLEIVIVDNLSKNTATLSYLNEIQKDPRVKVVKYADTFNYSAINNLGFRESSGEVIALLNNDIKVISPGWLKEMVSHALRPGIGAVGAKLLYPDDTVQHAGIILGVRGVASHAHKLILRNSPGYFSRAMLIQNLSAVTGACMVLRREVFEELGGLDEVNLTVALNDVDFCMRLLENNYRIVWTPYAELYHLESASRGRDDTPENAARFSKEIEYMRRAWEDRLNSDPCYSQNLTLDREDFSLAMPPRVLKPWKTSPSRLNSKDSGI